MSKYTSGWAVFNSAGHFVYAAYTEEMAKALAAVVVSPLRSWDELDKIGFLCTPATITPKQEASHD